MMVTTITAYSMDTGVQTYTISHPKETADQYSGFAIAYATMCAGGKKEFNEMANYNDGGKPTPLGVGWIAI